MLQTAWEYRISQDTMGLNVQIPSIFGTAATPITITIVKLVTKSETFCIDIRLLSSGLRNTWDLGGKAWGEWGLGEGRDFSAMKSSFQSGHFLQLDWSLLLEISCNPRRSPPTTWRLATLVELCLPKTALASTANRTGRLLEITCPRMSKFSSFLAL